MLIALGGDPLYADEPERLVKVDRLIPVYPDSEGYFGFIDAKKLGIAAALLGAGRFKKSDPIDPAVGILMKKRYGDAAGFNEPYAYIYVNNEDRLEEALSLVKEAVVVTAEPPEKLPLVYDIIK
jgi:pyrimidine-nucleoside phosphorylase